MLSSANEFPILFPCESKQVFAIPPPNSNKSTLLANESKRPSFVDTFEPPITATKGLFGSEKALFSE